MGSKPELESGAHLFDCLPSMQEALNSIPRATQTGPLGDTHNPRAQEAEAGSSEV